MPSVPPSSAPSGKQVAALESGDTDESVVGVPPSSSPSAEAEPAAPEVPLEEPAVPAVPPEPAVPDPPPALPWSPLSTVVTVQAGRADAARSAVRARNFSTFISMKRPPVKDAGRDLEATANRMDKSLRLLGKT